MQVIARRIELIILLSFHTLKSQFNYHNEEAVIQRGLQLCVFQGNVTTQFLQISCRTPMFSLSNVSGPELTCQ